MTESREEFDVVTEQGKPAVILARPERVGGPEAWVERQRDRIRSVVAGHGAAVVRGLELVELPRIDLASRLLSTSIMVEREGFAPREQRRRHLYSGTKWPSDQVMCMHHELSYLRTAPSLVMFSCLTAPSEGGATAVADAAAVLGDLPGDLVRRVAAEGWWLDRNYHEEIGVPWEASFGTSDRGAVEKYCRDNDIEFAWTNGGLRTSQLRPGVVTHPGTGRRCWFNQLAFLNEHTMEPDVRDYLLAAFGPAGLPFTTRFGDGEPLDRATVDLVNKVYGEHTSREPWQRGDLLLVDNIRMAHSREPYRGERDVVAAFADPFEPAALR